MIWKLEYLKLNNLFIYFYNEKLKNR